MWFVPINGKWLGNGKFLQKKRDGVDEHFYQFFYENNYVPAINRLDFNLPHVTIIVTNNCGGGMWIF